MATSTGAGLGKGNSGTGAGNKVTAASAFVATGKTDSHQ